MRASLIMSLPRVLSIQSHTVFGFVGNKAATFPLQTMGFNVDCINTVSLSNHPAYSAGCKGQALQPETLSDIVIGLENNSLLNYDVVLTGYTRSEEHLDAIERTVKKIRSINPRVLYLCDPVLGDNGDYYVPSNLLNIYKEKLLPIANIVTPNMFESQVLSGMSIHTYADAIEACRRIHDMGPDICILTGLTLPSLPSDKLTSVISVKSWRCLEKYKYHARDRTEQHLPTISSLSSDEQVAYQVTFQKEAGYFAGCGDLLAALTVASTHYLRCSENFFPLESATSKQDIAAHSTHTPSHSAHPLTPAVLGDLLEHLVQSMSKVVTNTRLRQSRELSILESKHVYEHHVTSMFGRGVYKNHDNWHGEDSSSDPILVNTHKSSMFYPFRSFKIKSAEKRLLGVIFDMDGTLTEGGAIDFARMYARIGVAKHPTKDLLTLISEMSSEEKQRAMSIVYEEEMAALSRQRIRPHCQELLDFLGREKIHVALSTRNCYDALAHFMQQAALDASTFGPCLHRDSLDGVNKPDPLIVLTCLTHWGATPTPTPAGVQSTPAQLPLTLFVGDSADDMKCGRDGGCKTVMLRDGEGVGGDVDMVVGDLKELLEEIKKMI